MFKLTTNTLERLAEAETLLVELRESVREPNFFRRRANTFIAVLRSVPLMIQADYRTRPGFAQWWQAHDTRIVPELGQIKTLRDLSMKERTLGADDYGPPEEAVRTFDAHLAFMRALVADAMANFEGKG
jgi:hypothetical protein